MSPPPRRHQVLTRNPLMPRHRTRTTRPHPPRYLLSDRGHIHHQHHPDPRGQDHDLAALVGGDVIGRDSVGGGGPDVGGQPTRNSRTTRRRATGCRNREHPSGSVDEACSAVRLGVHRTTAVRRGPRSRSEERRCADRGRRRVRHGGSVSATNTQPDDADGRHAGGSAAPLVRPTRSHYESPVSTIDSRPTPSRNLSLHREFQIFAPADQNARQPGPDIDRFDPGRAVEHRT